MFVGHYGVSFAAKRAAAGTALIGYTAFATLIWWLVDRRR
jgi:hypothetical protein